MKSTCRTQKLIFWTVLIVLATGFTTGAADKKEFDTLEKKASYVFAIQIVDNLKAKGMKIDLDAFVKGATEALNNQPCVFNRAEQAKIKTEYFMELDKQRVAALEEARKLAVDDSGRITEGDSGWKTKLSKPDVMLFDPAYDYFWVLETNKGNIKIKFMPDVAPMHVSSTIFLTNKGFYDNLTFHRVIPGFMAQGGCPLGTGTGGPGYNYSGEFSDRVKHNKPYLLSMANAGPGTDGSQFFLTFAATTWLDGKHTIFGEITEGQDVMKKLEAAGSQSGKPKEKLFIIKASIEVTKKTS